MFHCYLPKAWMETPIRNDTAILGSDCLWDMPSILLACLLLGLFNTHMDLPNPKVVAKMISRFSLCTTTKGVVQNSKNIRNHLEIIVKNLLNNVLMY